MMAPHLMIVCFTMQNFCCECCMKASGVLSSLGETHENHRNDVVATATPFRKFELCQKLRNVETSLCQRASPL
jgi:hypothetical protein